MTPLPKRKLSTRRQGDRRLHIKLALTALVPCPNCKKMMRRHKVCPNCGYYNNKAIKVHKQKKAPKK